MFDPLRRLTPFLLIVALLAGCTLQSSGPPNPETQQIRIGVALYKQDDTFISTLSDYLQDFARQREALDNVKIELNILDSKGNQSIQNDQVGKLITQGYDVLCINEVDRTAASDLINRAKTANVPVIFFNREPVQEDMRLWDRIYYVGSTPSDAGRMQAELVLSLYEQNPAIDRNGDGQLQYVLFEGELGHQDAIIRTEYLVRELRIAGFWPDKLDTATANWQRAQAAPRMEQWIDEFGDQIEVVFSNNDDMALGAIDAYRTKELLEQRPVIVGVDGTPPALEAIRDGTMDGTVLNDAKEQARAIFEIAYACATHNELQLPELLPNLQNQYIRLPHRILTAETLTTPSVF